MENLRRGCVGRSGIFPRKTGRRLSGEMRLFFPVDAGHAVTETSDQPGFITAAAECPGGIILRSRIRNQGDISKGDDIRTDIIVVVELAVVSPFEK